MENHTDWVVNKREEDLMSWWNYCSPRCFDAKDSPCIQIKVWQTGWMENNEIQFAVILSRIPVLSNFPVYFGNILWKVNTSIILCWVIKSLLHLKGITYEAYYAIKTFRRTYTNTFRVLLLKNSKVCSIISQSCPPPANSLNNIHQASTCTARFMK